MEAKPSDGRRDLWLHGFLFLGLFIFPFLLSAVTAEVAFERSKSVQFCASCHVMEPFVNDLRNPDSELLAARHYAYRRINHDQCFTCHSDYDFLGPAKAKLHGMRHMAVYYFSSGRKPPHLYSPFKNSSCLQCHEGAKSFVRAAAHQEIMEQIHSNEMSCVDCHGPAHPAAKLP